MVTLNQDHKYCFFPPSTFLKTGFHCVALADLRVLILPPQTPECWVYSWTAPHLGQNLAGLKLKGPYVPYRPTESFVARYLRQGTLETNRCSLFTVWWAGKSKTESSMDLVSGECLPHTVTSLCHHHMG